MDGTNLLLFCIWNHPVLTGSFDLHMCVLASSWSQLLLVVYLLKVLSKIFIYALPVNLYPIAYDPKLTISLLLELASVHISLLDLKCLHQVMNLFHLMEQKYM